MTEEAPEKKGLRLKLATGALAAVAALAIAVPAVSAQEADDPTTQEEEPSTDQVEPDTDSSDGGSTDPGAESEEGEGREGCRKGERPGSDAESPDEGAVPPAALSTS